jgi:hypothetical protein
MRKMVYLVITLALIFGNTASALAVSVKQTYMINGEYVSREEFIARTGIVPYNGPTAEEEKAKRTSLAQMLDEILSKITNVKMTETQKVKAVYDFLIFQFVHMDQKPLSKSPKIEYAKTEGYTSEINVDPFLVYASGILQTGEGSCYNFASIFAALLSRLGIQVEIWEGLYVNKDGTKQQHAWNKAYVDGAWKCYDVDVEGTVYRRSGTVLYFLYAKNDKEWTATHDNMYLGRSADETAAWFTDIPKNGAVATPTPSADSSPS